MQEDSVWFKTWFDSPYYHILYKHRDETEAKYFLDNLINYLNPSPEANFLDIGCGKGRHAIYLHRKGYQVTGVDLSPESIKHANQQAEEGLAFAVHDMREVFRANAYDYVVNLFTSFGFFETKEAHQHTVQAMAENLKPNGKLIIDFMNPTVVINQLVKEEQKTIEGITFHIKRFEENGMIIKQIMFEDQGQKYSFQEQVKALTYSDFLAFFEAANLSVCDTFGSYDLQDYIPNESPRMIFITKK